MMTLDRVLSPFLDAIGVRYCTGHRNLPSTVNHAINHYSNTHCFNYVNTFCTDNDISITEMFQHIGYPASATATSHIERLKSSISLRYKSITITDTCVHTTMQGLLEVLPINVVTQPRRLINIDTIEVVDALEYLSMMDERPIKRVDGLSLTQDIGFMTGMTLRQYIETADRYYLVQALPNLIERESMKLSNVLRHLEDNAFGKLPLHLSTLIISVEASEYVCTKEFINELVLRTWPLPNHRFELLLDKFPVLPKLNMKHPIASTLFLNPDKHSQIA